jgi:uncharacterized protein YndB with AHSA1/START domain
MTDTGRSTDLRLEQVLDATPELVWEAWTDPVHLAEWWGPDLFVTPRCEVDARPGGAIRIDMAGPDGVTYPMTGEFRELVRPERLVLVTTPIDDGGHPLFEVLLTVTLAPEGEHTRLTLEAEVLSQGPEAPQYLAGMEVGWTQSLGKLARKVAG